MSKKELFKRYLLFTASLFFAALGVAITRHGELGVSPISSVANVMSYQFPSLSLGTWLILWNGVLIVGQVLMLRKEFQPIQLLQPPSLSCSALLRILGCGACRGSRSTPILSSWR